MHLLENAMRMAAVCGLQSVDEAVRNVDLHVAQFMPYKEVPAYLHRLYQQYECWKSAECGDMIPKWIVEEEDRKMEEFFAKERLQVQKSMLL
jgi:hypothetical protein